jgi:hypothetical protein
MIGLAIRWAMDRFRGRTSETTPPADFGVGVWRNPPVVELLRGD